VVEAGFLREFLGTSGEVLWTPERFLPFLKRPVGVVENGD
jgi:hypothetical protein